jgi:hypothetical protein
VKAFLAFASTFCDLTGEDLFRILNMGACVSSAELTPCSVDFMAQSFQQVPVRQLKLAQL